MARRIVVAINESQLSLSVLRWALTEARTGDEVDAVLVWNLARFGVLENPFANLDDAARHHAEAARRLLARAEAEVAGDMADGVGTRVDVRHGDPVQEIRRAAEGATLLVLGNRPHGTIGRLGSVAADVISSVHCPTVLVPGSPARDHEATGKHQDIQL